MWNLTQVVKLSDGIFFANEFCEIWIEFFFFFWEVPRDEIKEKNWMKNKKNMGREKSNNDREGT